MTTRDDEEGRVAPVYVAEQATVYRAGGRRYFTRSAAIKRYARERYFQKHPCECEQGDYASGYPGYDCGCFAGLLKVMPRYLRLLKRKLKARPTR